MDKARFQEYLDKYFEGTLLPQEKLAFYKALDDNNEYKEEFEMEQVIKNSVILFSRKKLKEKLDAIKTAEQTISKDDLMKPNGVSKKFIGIVLSIAAVFVFGIIAFVIKSNTSQEELLFSGMVEIQDEGSLSGMIEQVAEKPIQYNKIKDFEEFDNNNGTINYQIKPDTSIRLLGSAGLQKKKVKVIYSKKNQSFILTDSLITIFTSYKELTNVKIVEVVSMDEIKLFYNDSSMIIKK